MEIKFKNIILGFAILLFSYGCRDKGFGELGIKEVYLIGSSSPVEEQVSFDLGLNDKFISIYCSGTELPGTTVQASIEVDEQILKTHNDNLGENDEKLVLLPSTAYQLESKSTQIPNDAEYGLLRFKIDTKDLNGYQIYAIPFRLISSDPFPINEKMNTLIYKLKLVNSYSGFYRMVGSVNDISASSVKNLIASSSDSFIIYAETKTEIVSNNNYRILVKVNPDNSLNITSNTVEILSGSGSYDMSKNTFILNYVYIDPVTEVQKEVKETLIQEILSDEDSSID